MEIDRTQVMENQRRILVVILIGILLRLIPSIAANLISSEDGLYDGDSYSYTAFAKGLANFDFILE
ncbi:hypothetical protein HYT84_04920, partial [Candidatus Micrarchaeota archaeon]|nr:hypothetical protein [Candidatus Micrarchaeota archaeon]